MMMVDCKIYIATIHEKRYVATIHRMDLEKFNDYVWPLVEALNEGQTLIIEPNP